MPPLPIATARGTMVCGGHDDGAEPSSSELGSAHQNDWKLLCVSCKPCGRGSRLSRRLGTKWPRAFRQPAMHLHAQCRRRPYSAVFRTRLCACNRRHTLGLLKRGCGIDDHDRTRQAKQSVTQPRGVIGSRRRPTGTKISLFKVVPPAARRPMLHLTDAGPLEIGIINTGPPANSSLHGRRHTTLQHCT